MLVYQNLSRREEKVLAEKRFSEKRKAEDATGLVLDFFVPVLAVNEENREISWIMSSKVIQLKYLPSGNGFWCVATLGLVIEDFSGCASEFTWLVAVEAHVELLAIVWVGEVGMGDDLA